MNGTGYKDEGATVYSGHKWNADSPIGNADAHCVTCAYLRFPQVSASKGDLLSFGQASLKQAEQARRFPNPFG